MIRYGSTFSVCTSVTTSKNSSSVPNPPGKQMNAPAYFTNMTFFVEIVKVSAIVWYLLPSCSCGSVMLSPTLTPPALFRPFVARFHDARSTTGDDRQLVLTSNRAGFLSGLVIRVLWLRASTAEHRHGRADAAITSNPSTNSDMMRKMRPGFTGIGGQLTGLDHRVSLANGRLRVEMSAALYRTRERRGNASMHTSYPPKIPSGPVAELGI